MRIALVSYEYPPDTAVGGIATYMLQWARLLVSRGHDVEVFCASLSRLESSIEESIFVHRIKEENRSLFKKSILPLFTVRHQWKKFDVLESPEYNADGMLIKLAFPEVKLIVKLHAPSFIVNKYNENSYPSGCYNKLKYLLKLCIPFYNFGNDKHRIDEEKIFALSADFLTSPSYILRKIVAQRWRIPLSKINHLPNPYLPSSSYLSISPLKVSNVITFIGRLEKLKGIAIFSKVIPLVLKKHPTAKFRFIGEDKYINSLGQTGQQFLKNKLAKYINQIEFIQHLVLDKIPVYLEDTLICVFPSLWDNFPTVCLEAMSAGIPVVGSKNSGMSEMLSNPDAGILVDPKSHIEISNSICYLLKNPEIRIQLGYQARKNVLEKYNYSVLGMQFEKMINISQK